jgi:hypothetical protein
MTQKQFKKLQARADLLEKTIKKLAPKVVWEMVVELIELEMEAECNQ